MRIRRTAILLSIVVVLAILCFAYFSSRSSLPADANHIAFVGPMSGDGEAAGRMMSQAVQMLVDEINEDGGVNGRPVVVDVYDDQNDQTIAAAKAREIVEHNRAIAVIGHWYSSCSIAAGEVYQKNRVPAISPGSVDVRVTKDNDWYFRSIYNADTPARFMAYYIKEILQQPAVSIIREDLPYGANLAATFEETAERLGLRIHNWEFQVGDRDLPQTFSRIAAELRGEQDPGVILLAVHASEGVQLIRHLRDAGIQNAIIGGSSFSEQTFLDGFRQFPKERMDPGHYTDGLYVTTPFLFDTANETALRFKDAYQTTHEEAPDWSAAFAYDAAKLVIAALRHVSPAGRLENDRAQVRDYLAGLTSPDRAVRGVTGLNYFDKNGDAAKPVSIGRFRNKTVISALTQLQVVQDPAEVGDVEIATAQGRLLQINDTPMYKTNVVYAGVQIDSIDELNVPDLTCQMELQLWFRYQGDFDMANIEFLNSVEPIELEEPIVEEKAEQLTYRRYGIKGKFKLDFVPGRTSGQHFAGVAFRHRELTRSNLIFVPDVLGMGLSDGRSPVEEMNSAQVLNPSSGWAIRQVRLLQDTTQQNTLGSLEFLNDRDATVHYSRFNAAVRIERDTVTVRRRMSETTSAYVLAFSFLIMLLLFVFRRKRLVRSLPGLVWVLQLFCTLFMLLSAEVVTVESLLEELSTQDVELIILCFDVLWWAIPAYFLCAAINRFIWSPLEKATGQPVPMIARRMLSFLIYTLGFFGIVAFVFDQKITGLLATSGVVAMIIGLAIQINISNIFSGIALNLERPFKIGDWIKIGSHKEGMVVDITWRTTRVLTIFDTMLSIPNSTASESIIENFHFKNDEYWAGFTVHVDTRHPVQQVEKLLRDAVLETPELTSPWIAFAGVSDWAADYWVYGIARDYGTRFLRKRALWDNVVKHLKRAGIDPALKRQDVHMFRGIESPGAKAKEPLTVLEEIDIFRAFPDEGKQQLSQSMRRQRFRPNATIVQQGDHGDSLFIIIEGVVGVWVKIESGETIEVARMGAGAFFGEMALLTGEPRTASIITTSDTEVFEIRKADIAPFIEQQPEVSELLSEELTQRTLNREAQKKKHEVQEIDEESIYKQTLRKIQSFFGLRNE